MGKVQVLSEQIANQIAAGEVVERPSSVVKELVENSIDAGATQIEVSIEEGGLHYIRVLDNGSGMAVDDCELAFQRHATSKIRQSDDLFHIRSLGFRGEALPSIAAVSRLTCTTSADDSGLGRKLCIEGGQVTEFGECTAARGTDIQVRDLFFNTPARLKYMKTIQTELSHVSDYLYRAALAHPAISFHLTHNGQHLLQSPGNGDLLQAVAAVYGSATARAMVVVDAETIDYRLTGLVAKPELNRANRNGITLIVNGRVIRNYALNHALVEAYHTLLPIHRYPFAVLQIQMDPILVDVNVHPAKLEVRFSKEAELCGLVRSAVRARLTTTNLVPKAIDMTERNVSYQRPAMSSPPQQMQLPLYTREERVPVTERNAVTSRAPLPERVQESLISAPVEAPRTQLPHLFPVGQIHGTYIVAQNETGMYLIDQHAAHERLNYELFFEKMAKPEPIAQELLLPMTIERTSAEAKIIQSKLSLLEAVGVHMESFGLNSFIVRAYPAWFPAGDEQSLIHEMLESLLTEKTTLDLATFRERAAIMCACKASVKANQALSIRDMEVLLERLRNARVPFTCPHGRPIVISFSTYDLEKMFKRVM